MAGIFWPGQLVKVSALVGYEGYTDLYSVPGGTDDLRVIGRLTQHDVAAVVAVHRGGSAVYVIGPNGGGWTMGAYLEIVPTLIRWC